MDNNQERERVRMLVRVRDDYQQMRKRLDNRIGRKADGKDQNVSRVMDASDYALFRDLADHARKTEDELEKELLKRLRGIPIYSAFLAHVKGIGPIAAGWIVAEYDIYEATTVSKLWQFTGLNPGEVAGQRIVKGRDGKPLKDEHGKFQRERTGQMVQGDKMTQGFVSPFNQRLRTALMGVMADGFIKCQNDYALRFYYPYKKRLEQEENKIDGEEKAWCEVSKARRDMAAKRYMVKMFLRDLYVAWRTIEGLPVRAPYQEQYLGHEHEAQELAPVG